MLLITILFIISKFLVDILQFLCFIGNVFCTSILNGFKIRFMIYMYILHIHEIIPFIFNHLVIIYYYEYTIILFRVNQYNAGFGLLDDCKNMSFSELFDQELFSSHGNKDLTLLI